MTDHELQRKLAKAVERTAPNDFEGVLSRCETRKGNVIDMTEKKRRPVRRALIAACLALVLLGGSMAYQQTSAVASVISLDVNPSIELNVSRSERVLSCTALNAEAEEVLRDMNGGAELKGASLDVAVNAIVGALLRSGYLESLTSAILISVEDADQTRAVRLQEELTASVGGVLQSQQASAAVLSQTVEKSAELEQQAKENHISTGKAALVRKVMALNGTLGFEELAALSVEELKDLVETGAPGMPIGLAAAKQAAVSFAGGSDAGAVMAEVDAELDDRPAHYEVELRTAQGEFEYTVDAYTGEVTRGKANVLSGESSGGGNTAAEQPSGGSVSQPSSGAAESESPSTGGDIGSGKAKSIALTHAGLAASDVNRVQVERDFDDGRLEYEVEFRFEGIEYEYVIDAVTGDILKSEKDYDD